MIKDKILYIFLRIVIFIFSLIPFKILYLLSNLFRFFIVNVFLYRKKIIIDNLHRAFPNKSSFIVNKIKKDVYFNISDILLEGLKGYTISKKEIRKRFTLKNPELVEKYYLNNTNILLLSAHYTNWEWSALALPLLMNHECRSLYKPLSNILLNNFLYKRRSVFGNNLYPITNTFDFFNDKSNKPIVYYMVADQNPSNPNASCWVDFFNVNTAFLHGPQKYFEKLRNPVFYIHFDRIKRGYYQAELIELVSIADVNKEIDITLLYANLMEKLIKDNPGNWLWSHKRWKHSFKYEI